MARLIVLDEVPASYRGVRRILEFTNHDGRFTRYNCGQAAAASFLTHHGLLPPIEEHARDIMDRIEKSNPPDIIGGWFGSSRQCVERANGAFGLPLAEFRGEDALRDQISREQAALVMLEVPGPSLLKRWTIPTGHWMVAFGFDDQDVYLTNWGKMNWDLFRRRWQGLIPRLIGMCNRLLAAAE